MGRLDEFAPQAVSNVLWGCATLDFYHDEFFEAACAHIKSAALTGPEQLDACVQQTSITFLMPKLCTLTLEMYGLSVDAMLVACACSAVRCAAMLSHGHGRPSGHTHVCRAAVARLQRTAAATKSRRCPTACCPSASWSL